MRVEESVLPGVGRKFTVTVRSGDRLVIVIHHSGSRELQYVDEPTAVLDLTDEEARELGAILLLGLGAALVHRWHFPPLAAYLLVGLVLGEYLDIESLEPLPSLGLLLLMFLVGLEFGPDRLQQMSGRVLRAGGWDALALPIGVLVGILVGLDWKGALLLGGVMYVSSSAVIVKLILDLRRAANPESEVVLGVLVFEDLLIAILLVLVQGEQA